MRRRDGDGNIRAGGGDGVAPRLAGCIRSLQTPGSSRSFLILSFSIDRLFDAVVLFANPQ